MPAVAYHKGRFPPASLDWQRLIPLLGPAAAVVARYDGMLAAMLNPGLLLAPLTTREAVLSLRIEGTQATVSEVLEFEAGQEAASPEKREDIREVLNYRAAMHEAEQLLASLPLSQRVIREIHRTLLDGVRGQNKAPGEYRRIPNWIGPAGCTVDQARFVPIAADALPDGMGAWESYLHADAPDSLVQLAILHAEFEALHPFLDGNGRLGRMLVPLFLWQRGILQRPMFYISAGLEARREEYIERLLAVSRDDDWTGWCVFFLEAIRAQAEDNLAKARAILELYDEMKRRVPDLTRSRHAVRALDWIFSKPIFSTTEFVAASGIPAATARRFLAMLRAGGILVDLRPGHGQKPAILAFPELLNLTEGRTVL